MLPRRHLLLTAMAATLAVPGIPHAQARLQKVSVANQGAQFTYGPFYVAVHAGFFAEQGIEIEELAQRAVGITVSSVLSGDTPFGLAPTEAVILANARRQPLRSVALLIQGFPNMVILRRGIAEEIARSTGVTPRSPILDRARQLKGRTIVVTSAGSSLETVLLDQAQRAGLGRNDVTVIYSGGGAATAAALRAERVDGAVSGFPFAIEALSENRAVKWIDPPAGEVPELANMDFSTLLTSQALTRSNPDLVQRMVNAIAKAEVFIQREPAAARERLRRVFPNMAPPVLDLSFDTILPMFPRTPLSTEEGVAKAQTLLNRRINPQVNVPFAEVSDTSFAQRAVQALGG
jgi:NitT/TauT family transport system substrate-binding protein